MSRNLTIRYRKISVITRAVSALIKVLRTIYSFCLNFVAINSAGYKVKFRHEGSIQIRMPVIGFLGLLRGQFKLIHNEANFLSRPEKEVLLRRVIFHLFEFGYLDKRKSIIDIGCWLSDNALVWAQLLDGGSRVFAIDPSGDNLKFGRTIAELNEISNIQWVRAVCSDRIGQPLAFEGSLEHTQFAEATIDDESYILSTTLDEIVYASDCQDICLMHVDVEGFEEKVLRGSVRIIRESRPVILFEQHISTENVGSIVAFLSEEGYDIYMINEVLPGCRLDCRNFIAIDRIRPLSGPLLELLADQRDAVYFATIGSPLLRVLQ